jgi:hypothetical protein
MVLEATPGDLTAMQPEPSAPSETEESTAPDRTEPIPTETPGEASTQPSATRPQTGKPEAPEKKTDLSPLKWPLLLLLAAAAVWLQRKIRLDRRRIARETGAPNARALAMWRETEQLHRLLKTDPPEELEALAQKAKFSQYCLTEEELTRFASHLSETLQILRARPWYAQIIYRLIFALY